MQLAAAPLENAWVRLEPLSDALRDEVRAAVDVDPDAWSLMASYAYGERFEPWWRDVRARVAAGSRIAYAVRRQADARVVGVTSFMDPSAEHGRVEVGSTFLHPDARSGPVNPAAKRLMLGAAFDAGARRVELVTDPGNLRSQAAIAKLGAVREGVLRRHKTTWTGYVRDSMMFSVTDLDWPDVRARLDARLAAFTPDGG